MSAAEKFTPTEVDECERESALVGALGLDTPRDRQLHVDRVRVRGFALAMLDMAERAEAEYEAAVDLLLRARDAAEAARKRRDDITDLAGRLARFASRVEAGDVDREILAEAATAIEEIAG